VIYLSHKEIANIGASEIEDLAEAKILQMCEMNNVKEEDYSFKLTIITDDANQSFTLNQIDQVAEALGLLGSKEQFSALELSITQNGIDGEELTPILFKSKSS